MAERRFGWQVLSVLCAVATVGGQSTREDVDPTREFPSFERSLGFLVKQASDAAVADRAFREAPGAAATIEQLLDVMDTTRAGDAITALRTATAGDLENLIAAVNAVSQRFHVFTGDATKGYRDKVAEVVPAIRARLAGLPREDEARLARVLLNLDNQLSAGGSRGWNERIQTFVEQYRGTREGLRAEVAAIGMGTDTLARIAAYDLFWKQHPASEAGATALYQKGWDLAHNWPVRDRSADPTERFLQVVAVAEELESGRYPDGYWVRQAPQLVSEFYVSSSPPPAFAPGSVDRMIAAYQKLARTHFDTMWRNGELGNGVGYVITGRIGSLSALQGDRVGGIERSLADLEASGIDKNAIALLRAQFWTLEATGGPEAARAAMTPKAEAALTSLAAADASYYSRKAAATLAGFLMHQRDYPRARPAFERYATQYPGSAFRWVADLRAGQCSVELGDLERAATTFERIAPANPQQPMAQILGPAFAAKTFDALGQFDRALVAYRRALAGWSIDDRIYLNPGPSLRPVPAPATGVPTERETITTPTIADRITSLERHLKDPSGPFIERSIWQIERRQFVAAQDTLAQAAKQARAADVQREIRALVHRTQLELAMELAAIEGKTIDEAAASRSLDALVAEPFDSIVGLAGLAKATMLFKQDAAIEASSRMTSTLDAWIVAQRPQRAAKPASPVAADVAEIRKVVFQPTGSFELLAKEHWNAFAFPATQPYLILNPDVRVKTADGLAARLTVYQDLPGLGRTIFLTTDDITLASRLIVTLGGTKTGTPVDVMATPNQPMGSARDIMNFWNAFFPTRQGHWGGWVLETYPIIDRIEFLDDARTKASVFVTVGYSGATVVMEKRNGVWTAIKLVNQWIT